MHEGENFAAGANLILFISVYQRSLAVFLIPAAGRQAADER
jgi:hypothetical protein